MPSQAAAAIRLAWRDWRYEALLSLCAVLALASMLAPILILQGLKNGVAQGMRERLLKDPATLIITPKSDAGRFTPEFIAALARLPGASYVIGRTRDTATDITLRNGAASASIALEPATPGEPVLARHAIPAPKDGKIPELVLSHSAANALKAQKGMQITANLSRRAPDGRFESMPLAFRVSGVLPPEAATRKLAFAPLALLEDMENYRDYIAAPARGFTGANAAGSRVYASFRLYAKSLADVASLADYLNKEKIEVLTRAREIAAIQALEKATNQIILIISLAVGAGFLAFTLSSAEGAARRKKRMLGMLHLLGFRRFALLCYPLAQSLFTAICGFCLSLGIYTAVAFAIAQAFASRGGLDCRLSVAEACWAFWAVAALSALATARPAWQVADLEPSSVIREV